MKRIQIQIYLPRMLFQEKYGKQSQAESKELSKARNLEVSEGLHNSTESVGNFSGVAHALTPATSLKYFDHLKSQEKMHTYLV